MNRIYRFYTDLTLDEQVEKMYEDAQSGQQHASIPKGSDVLSPDAYSSPFYFIRKTRGANEYQLMQGCVNTTPSYMAYGQSWEEDIEPRLRELLKTQKESMKQIISSMTSDNHPMRKILEE